MTITSNDLRPSALLLFDAFRPEFEELRGEEIGDCRFEVVVVDEGFSSQEVLQRPEKVVVRWREIG